AKLASIPIIHVYGQLGRASYPGREALPYNASNATLPVVLRAAAGITLLHEEAEDLEKAKAALIAARRVVFVGLSYHPLNLKRLQLTETTRAEVYGTASGLEIGEVDQAKRRIRETLLLKKDPTLEVEDSLRFFRRHVLLG